ncbi:ABC transporter ATP-binding protein [Dyadobacter sediminis]|uniref:ABC transporter ATP-binding protein n=1 Tax=Dyadobacter sediminis TaxID=1493691 RepID=A0A5R9KED8_9BACT|nr:ABC transporter ATP-binding protein [Dyadobacter sediminis]TLU94494.1 ABC transporter ATP-binding protein [Dyadobacter sediminis]GGB90758.1 ABC transporter ATP-binding protein [Dyadobacter sediminis]
MPVIVAENISKKYIIDHQRKTGSPSLRDIVTDTLDKWFSGKRDDSGFAEKEEFWALRDVNFSIDQGDRIGIVGHNGAGKSTLLKILSRITEPTTGQIKINGRIASLLEVGTGFHPELTGRENIFLNGAILGMSKSEIRQSFDAIVDFAGVEKFLDTPVKRYSSGMYVRLGFAIAAHLNPEILIVDEVLAVGDTEFQKKCLGKMRDVSESGRTLLFVSHNLTAIQALCNKSFYFEKGRLIDQGETTHIITNYLSKVSHKMLEKHWDNIESAPGNDQVRIKSFRLIPEYQDDLHHIDVRTPVSFEFEFWNLIEEANLNLSMHLYTFTGECIFNVGTQSESFAKGLVSGKCELPGNFLNDGSYVVSMMIVKDTSTVLYNMEEALVFDIEDYRENVTWYGKWPGYIRPQLNFSIRQIEHAVND